MNILTPGSLVGKYRVVGQLSAGGMGLIYRAVHPVLGTQVAIKTIRPELADDPSIVERFLREAMSASRVRDSRLPDIYDQDTLPDGTPYMVMELLHGEDLATRLGAGPIMPADAARIMVEVLEVLHKVHLLDIVHRDLKPQNIFLARDEVYGEIPKLLDFGVAHFANEVQRQTRAGEMMGTPLYMAVEQAQRGGVITPRTDVFSAGIVLYECLAGSGERPWGDGSPMAYVTQLNMRTPARPLAKVAPKGCPDALCTVVMKAIELDPADRFHSAAEFARALEPFARARGARYRARRPAGTPAPQFSRPATAQTEAPRRDPAARHASAIVSSSTIRQLTERLSRLRSGGDPTATARLRPGERRQIYLLALRYHIQQSQGLLLDESDLELVRAQVAQLFETALAAEGASLRNAFGTTLIASFGHERTLEDGARSALLAAHELIRRRGYIDSELVDLGCSVSVCVGLHCGFVVHTGGPQPLTLASATTEVVAALAEHAPWNTVLVSGPFREAVEQHGEFRQMGPLQQRNGENIATFEARETLSAMWQSATELPLIGRAQELAALTKALAQAGPPRVVLLVGPAGVGKTRLLRELATQGNLALTWAAPVPLRPFGLIASLVQDVLFGATSNRPNTWLLQSRLEVLARNLEGMDSARLRDYGEECALLLGRRVLSDAPHTEAATVQGELGAFVGLLLTAHARQRPPGERLVVVFDELQDADVSSVRLLEGLLEHIAPEVPLHLVVARRVGEHLELPRHIARDEILLGPLGDPEVDALIDALSEQPASAAVRALVRDRAQGNPLFVGELMFTLDANGLIDAHTQQLASFPLPWSLYGVLLARVDRLPPELRAAVQCLAVVGDPVDPRVWAAVFRATGAGARGRIREPHVPLVELDDAGVLRRVIHEGVEQFVFVQPLLRHAVYDTVLPDNRRTVHAICAQTLEALPDKDTLGRDVLLLHHYRNTDNVAKTLDYARRVGRGALGMGASDQAGEALDLAVTLQAQVPPEAPLERANTLIDAGWARFYLARLLGAMHAGTDAAALLDDGPPRRPDNEDEALKLRVLAKAHMLVATSATYLADWDVAPAQLELAEYLFELAGRPEDSARARCQLGFVLRSMGKPEEGIEMARDGYLVLRASSNRSAFVRAAHDLGNILRDLGQHAEAIAVFDEAIAVGEDLSAEGRHFGAKWALAARSGRAMALAAVGRHEEAAAAQLDAYQEAVHRRHLVAQAVTACHLAENYFDLGRPDDARHFAQIALDISGRIQMPRRAVRARLLLARLDNAAGQPRLAREHLEAAEFLARAAESTESHVGDVLWFEVLEPLLAAQSEAGLIDAVLDALDEATTRAARRGERALIERIDLLRERYAPTEEA